MNDTINEQSHEQMNDSSGSAGARQAFLDAVTHALDAYDTATTIPGPVTGPPVPVDQLPAWTYEHRWTATAQEHRRHQLQRIAYLAQVVAALPVEAEMTVSVASVDHRMSIQVFEGLDLPAAEQFAASLGLTGYDVKRPDDGRGHTYHSWFAGDRAESPLILTVTVYSQPVNTDRAATSEPERDA